MEYPGGGKVSVQNDTINGAYISCVYVCSSSLVSVFQPGDVIDVCVQFNRPIEVIGSPKLFVPGKTLDNPENIFSNTLAFVQLRIAHNHIEFSFLIFITI